jgi:hypothetical protein
LRPGQRTISNTGRPRGAAGAAVLLIVTLAPLFFAPAASALPTPPNCVVTVDSIAKTAHVSNTLGDTLDFSGAINVTTGSSSPRSLNIVANMSNDWASTINPSNANISDGAMVRFNASVAVPVGAAASARATFTIGGGFEAVPGFKGSLVTCAGTAQINVAQYYAVLADSQQLRVNVSAGPTGQVASVIAQNLGNGKDTFSLDISEADKLLLQDEGLYSNLPLRVTVEAGAQTNITFSINATDSAQPGNWPFNVTLRSVLSPQTASASLSFIVVVKPSILGSLIPSSSSLILILLAVAGLVGTLFARRVLKRRRAAAEARRQLQKVLRQRREGGLGGEEAYDGGFENSGDAGAPEDSGPGSGAPPQEAAPTEEPRPPVRVRVKVKAPRNP